MTRTRTRVRTQQILERARAAGFIHRCAAVGCASYTKDKYCFGCARLYERDVLVYFIGVPALGNVVKIGQTRGMTARLNSISTGCPYPPEVLATVNADGMLERRLHEHFAEYRIHLEWFRLQRPLQEVVDLARGGQLQKAVDKSFASVDRGGTVLQFGEPYAGTKIRRIHEVPAEFPNCAKLIEYARELKNK